MTFLRTMTIGLAIPALLVLSAASVAAAAAQESSALHSPHIPRNPTLRNSTALLASPSSPMLLLSGGAALMTGFFLWGRQRSNHRRQVRERENELARRLANAERQWALAETRYRQVLNYAGDALFFIDPRTGQLIDANRGAEDLLGYSAEQIRSLSLAVLFPRNHQRRYLRLVKKVLRDGYGEESRLLFRCRHGREFTGAVHARLGVLGTEEVVHGVLRDVSRINRTEQELRQKNKDLQLVNRIAYKGAASRDLSQMLDDVLAEVVSHLETDGGGLYLVRHAEETLDLVAHRGIENDMLDELRRIRPGQGLAGRVASSGQPRSSVDLGRDRRLKTESIRTAGWRGFQAVPLISNDRNAGVLFLYNFKRRIFGREEVRLLLAIGRQIGTAVESGQLFEALNWQHRLTQASNRELERSREQLREHLKKLEESNRTLERLDQMKNQFLTLASHELRTPLTYVLSGSEHLLEQLRGRLDTDEMRFLEAIHEGGNRLNMIVKNLLEVAQLESQSLYLAKEPLDLRPILAQLEDEFRPTAELRGLELRLDPPPEPLTLQGDPIHLHKTFQRLLENAVKFTDGGGRVTVSATTRAPREVLALRPSVEAFSPAFFARKPSGPFAQVTVSDTGIGIDPDERHLVFDKFYESGDVTGHFTSSSRFGGKGVGLGLTLVKGMIEAHGGVVWVDSSENGGSDFHVLLPMENARV